MRRRSVSCVLNRMGKKDVLWWMFGRTPPWAIVTCPRSLFNSSSLRIASCRWRGMIRVFLLSRAAFPANSRISAARYSSTAARYTGAPTQKIKCQRRVKFKVKRGSLTGTDTLSVVALSQETVYATDGEGQASLGRTAIDFKLVSI